MMPKWLSRFARSLVLTGTVVGSLIGMFFNARDMLPPAVVMWVALHFELALVLVGGLGVAIFVLSYLLLVPALEPARSSMLGLGGGLAVSDTGSPRQFDDFDYEIRFAVSGDEEGTFAVAESRFEGGIILPFERHREWAASGRGFVRVMTERPASANGAARIVSYYSVLPLPLATYRALIEETISEKDLTADRLTTWQAPDLHAIYICAIVRNRDKDFAGSLMLRDLARYIRHLSQTTRASLVAAWTIDRASTGYATDVGMRIVGRPKAYANSAFCEGEPLRDGAEQLNNRFLARFLSRPFEERYDPL